MSGKAPRSTGADLIGASRLVVEAVAGVTELVEAVHLNVLERAIGTPAVKPIAGVTRLVYRSVKGVTRLVGGGLDAVLDRLQPLLAEPGWNGREPMLAALNGVLGDRLALARNPLAIPMQFRRGGAPLALQSVSGKVLVLVHGLCMNDLQWARQGEGHGAALEQERGYTAVYLHYNSGRHISINGREFAHKLQALVAQWPVPVEELVVVCHSMGGLVTRSACHYGALEQHTWPGLVRKLVFLGTPHHGAPLERGGNWVNLFTDLNAYSAPFSKLAKVRSAGITDLRHGSVLDEDWQDKDRFEQGGLPVFLPLPPGVACLAVAATVGKEERSLADRIAGDGLVPVASALGEHADPARCLAMEHAVFVRTNHMDLLSSAEVRQRLMSFL